MELAASHVKSYFVQASEQFTCSRSIGHKFGK
jgi:hypothetical protein